LDKHLDTPRNANGPVKINGCNTVRDFDFKAI